MKNNPSSLINKFADIHSELVKLNKRICNLEIIQEKTNESIKVEESQRLQIEKKNFSQSEHINGKIISLKKGMDDISNGITAQFESFKVMFEENLKGNNERLISSLEEKINKIDLIDKKIICNERASSENTEKMQKTFTASVDSLSSEYRKLKTEVEKQAVLISNNERKNLDLFNTLSGDIKEIMKQVVIFKNDIEILKNFKESTIMNFKDITNEFINK